MFKYFTLVLYTAGTQDYADKILGCLGLPQGLFKLRLYRDDCVKTKNRVAIFHFETNDLATYEGHANFQFGQNPLKPGKVLEFLVPISTTKEDLLG